MLRTFVEQKHYKFAEEAKDWKDAIRMSCESLEAGKSPFLCHRIRTQQPEGILRPEPVGALISV